MSKDPGLFQIQLDDLIDIWNFGLEHGKELLCIERLLELNEHAYYITDAITFDVNRVASTLIDIFEYVAANGFVQELCASYFARNFVRAKLPFSF